ncbi:hypothetical protein YQE_01732, partial [Dendroctonus ponderosae]
MRKAKYILKKPHVFKRYLNTTISFVGELNVLMKYLIFVECTVISIIIASVLFQLIFVPTSLAASTLYIAVSCTVLSQIFVLSWISNEIEVESLSISDALFESRWYEQTQKVKKIIIIIMMRSRKPLRIMIGPFYPLTIHTALNLKKEFDLREKQTKHLETAAPDKDINEIKKLIDEAHEDATEFSRLINELHKAWLELKEAIDNRRANLLRNERAQQYRFDPNEAESWMSEQELYMVEERGRDETSARNFMKKYGSLVAAVEAYADTIRGLGETVKALSAEGHPLAEQVAVKQSQLDKLYAGLKDLAQERRAKLDEALQLFLINREVGDLEQWIADRKVVASSHELGQDYDHVTLLWERFMEFAHDTETIRSERVAGVNDIADYLIAAGHSDSATIAEWKDGLNEAWQD